MAVRWPVCVTLVLILNSISLTMYRSSCSTSVSKREAVLASLSYASIDSGYDAVAVYQIVLDIPFLRVILGTTQ